MQLDDTARAWLLHHARQSIAAHLEGSPLPTGEDHPPATKQYQGCFVSIHTRAGMLRGCIGNFESVSPLWQNVQAMAIAAATEDPRFPPMTPRELTDCNLEISALTPREPAKPEDIQVGKHGLWVTRGHQRGVLLPQVATAQQWNPQTFLNHTCIKAGMPQNAWRDGSVSIYTFQADVFAE